MEISYSEKVAEKTILSRIKSAVKLNITADESLFIKGNNFDAMAALLNSGFEGKIDLVYIDPPFNTNQTFTVESCGGRVSTVSRCSSTLVAYSDSMSQAEYLEFMRERLILIRELMSSSSSIYLHIDNKMGHYLKLIMDEVFGQANFLNDITRVKSNPKNFMRSAYGNQKDMILYYAKSKNANIFHNITIKLSEADKVKMFRKVDVSGRRYNTVPVHAPGETKNGKTGEKWRNMAPPKGRHWRTDPAELEELDRNGLIEWSKNGVPRIKKYADEHKGKKVQDVWHYIDPSYPLYPTEKNLDMLELIIKQSSNENSIVLDCFAGSGATLLAAKNTGRRWIGIDQSDFSADIVRGRFNNSDYMFIDIS